MGALGGGEMERNGRGEEGERGGEGRREVCWLQPPPPPKKKNGSLYSPLRPIRLDQLN